MAITEYELYVAGGSFPPANGRFYDTRRSLHGRAVGARPGRGRGGRRPRRRRRARGVRGRVGRADGLRALAADAPARRPDRARRRPPRRARVARLAASCCASSPARCGCCRPGTATSRAGRTSSPGESIPSDKPNFVAFTQRVPVGVVAAVVPWNSPLLLLTLEARAGAGHRLHDGRQADRPHARDRAGAGQARDRGGHPGRRVQRHHGQRARGRARAGAPPRRRQGRVHRLDRRPASTSPRARRSHLARVTLELGGKSAQIVFPDADLEAAANGVIAGVFAATGQTCMAGSRLIVHEDVHDELIERVAARAREIVLGNPLEAATEMGPLANAQQFAQGHGHPRGGARAGRRPRSAAAARSGARRLLRRSRRCSPASTPTRPPCARRSSAPSWRRCASATRTRRSRMANDTEYGLAGSVWTLDVRRAMRVAQRLRAGTVWVNAYRVVGPNVPFGGFGASGIGRENGLRRAARVHRDALDLDRDLRRDARPVHARVTRRRADTGRTGRGRLRISGDSARDHRGCAYPAGPRLAGRGAERADRR